MEKQRCSVGVEKHSWKETIRSVLFTASHNWDNWWFNANTGHKTKPQNTVTDHRHATRQTCRGAAVCLIRLQLGYRWNSLSKMLEKCSSADVKFKTHASMFQSHWIPSSVCLPAFLSIARSRLPCKNAGMVQRTWQHAKGGRAKGRENKREREG